jgi:prepilin-type N-terminal cleavage/methylation domain-containing protein
MKRFSSLKIFHKSQPGFTLIEIIVALAITGVLAAVIATSIYQVSMVNAGSTSRVSAVTQVENAVHYINRDVQMSQKVQPQGSQGFPLTLSWTAWDDNSLNQVVYKLQSGNLVRTFSINGGTPTTKTVAVAISAASADTNCSYANHALTLKISSSATSNFKQDTETRICQIIPRPGS